MFYKLSGQKVGSLGLFLMYFSLMSYSFQVQNILGGVEEGRGGGGEGVGWGGVGIGNDNQCCAVNNMDASCLVRR